MIFRISFATAFVVLATASLAAPNELGVGQIELAGAVWACPDDSMMTGVKAGTLTPNGLTGVATCADALATAKHMAEYLGQPVSITEEVDGTWSVLTTN